MSKDEILESVQKKYPRNFSKLGNVVYLKGIVFKAMQEYSDQENARLTAIVSKQDELIDEMLHGNVHNIDHWNKQGKLLSELEKLKAE